ncbi:MAG: hypothetical protein U0905_06200 [Pirellulales bacterium]
MRTIAMFLVGLMVTSMVGCGPKVEEHSQKVTGAAPQGAEALKPILEDLVAKGTVLGSGGMVIQSYVDQISQKDPEKAKALQKHVDLIISMQEPAKIKAKAKEMLDILNK